MAGMALVPVLAGTPISNQVVWGNWNQATTTAATTSTSLTLPADTVWAYWNQTAANQTSAVYSATTTLDYALPVWTTWNTVYEETQEQRQARERAQAQAALERQEAQRERVVAKERALELLGYWLSEEQMASYRDHGFFEVISSKGRRWRIRDRGQSGNVDLMPEIGNEREASYCAHPPGALPDPDAHLAQVLTLVTDEDAFLRVANCHYRRAA